MAGASSLVLITEETGCLTYADVLAPDVELVALARALVVAPGVLAVAVRAGARQLLPALVQVWRWRRSRDDMDDGSDTVSIDQLSDSEFQVQHGEPTFAFVAVAVEPRRAPAPGQRGLLQSPASVELVTGHCRRKSGSKWERTEDGGVAAYRAGGEGLLPSRLRPAPAVVQRAPPRPDRWSHRHGTAHQGRYQRRVEQSRKQ